MRYQPKRLRRLHSVWLDHGQPTYFITICVAVRSQSPLAKEAVHRRLREFLQATASHHDWWAKRYVLMPDHLHLLATPGLNAVTLGAWIKALKAYVGNREFKWQTGFFDHALRSDESESEKWEYIRRNPERAGLIADAAEWPYAGEIDSAQGRGDIPPAPRQETRPTAGAIVQGTASPTDVGPVSRSGARATSPRGNGSLPPHRLPTAKTITLTRYANAGPLETRTDEVATEEPLEIRIEGRSVAVVMRTPGYDRELAAGFLLTENLIRSASDIFDITQCGSSAADQVVNVTLRDPRAFDPAKLTRNVFSSSSCGVCSKATIDAVRQSFPPITDNCTVAAETILKLPGRLREQQETFERTGGLHACALFDCDGELLALREDVGRHNALDKLIGRALLDDQLPLRGRILFLSGRVSFEMMQKALAAGIPIVAAISAPTTLAVDFARESNQTLIGFVRGQTMNIYSGAERVVGRVS